jgi:type IV secretion system protein VirD4
VSAGDPLATDPANGGIRQEAELPEHEEVSPLRMPADEFALLDDEPDDEPQRQRVLARMQTQVARVAAMDRDDGLGLGM